MMRQNLRKVWTPDEDAVLRSLAPSVSPQRIAVRLNRGLGSALKRADDLKIRLLNKARLRKQARRSELNARDRPSSRVHRATQFIGSSRHQAVFGVVSGVASAVNEAVSKQAAPLLSQYQPAPK